MENTEHIADLDLHPNEASGLLRVGDPGLLDGYSWDRAFWSVLDEVDVEDCVAIIGHAAGAPIEHGWDIARLAVQRRGDDGRADDAEALARHDGWVYLFGSQHGGKEGPIRRREQWVARFRESDVTPDGPRAPLEVIRTHFALHRIVNDALHAGELRLVPMHQATRAAFITDTAAELEGSPDAGQVHPDDWTINVEGAEFTASGTLLLGLRFPVTEDGRPVVVALDGCERLFDGGLPDVSGLHSVDAVGRGGELAGVRDLCMLGDELHLVTGNLDSKGKGSVILADYPGGRDTVNTHFVTVLDDSRRELPAQALREFPAHPRIEGLASDGRGRFFYVSDEDEAVDLRATPLLSTTD